MNLKIAWVGSIPEMDKEKSSSPVPYSHPGREWECCFPPHFQHGGLTEILTLGSVTQCPHENILFGGKPFRHQERCPFIPFLSSARVLGATRIGGIRLELQQVLAFLWVDQSTYSGGMPGSTLMKMPPDSSQGYVLEHPSPGCSEQK